MSFPDPPPGFRIDAFADARMGCSLFQMRPADWLVPIEPPAVPSWPAEWAVPPRRGAIDAPERPGDRAHLIAWLDRANVRP
jgi:hypothetical protein